MTFKQQPVAFTREDLQVIGMALNLYITMYDSQEEKSIAERVKRARTLLTFLAKRVG